MPRLIVPFCPYDYCLIGKEFRGLVGNLVAMTATIDENRSTHCEISVMGGRPGSGGRPGMWSDVASTVTSDIFYKFQIQDLFGNLCRQ